MTEEIDLSRDDDDMEEAELVQPSFLLTAATPSTSTNASTSALISTSTSSTFPLSSSSSHHKSNFSQSTSPFVPSRLAANSSSSSSSPPVDPTSTPKKAAKLADLETSFKNHIAQTEKLIKQLTGQLYSVLQSQTEMSKVLATSEAERKLQGIEIRTLRAEMELMRKETEAKERLAQLERELAVVRRREEEVERAGRVELPRVARQIVPAPVPSSDVNEEEVAARRARSCNAVIYKLDKSPSSLNELLTKLPNAPKPISISSPSPTSSNPHRLTFSSSFDLNKFFQEFNALAPKGPSATRDLTPAQQAQRRRALKRVEEIRATGGKASIRGDRIAILDDEGRLASWEEVA